MMPFISARIQGLKKVVADWVGDEEWKIDLVGYIVFPCLLLLMFAFITSPYWLSGS